MYTFHLRNTTRAYIPVRFHLLARHPSRSDRINSELQLCQFQTLASGGCYTSEIEVKKSRFIGYARHVDSWSEAQVHIEAIKKEHPKARHWCFAYCGGTNPVCERSSDDGEPTGTAGAPILNAIHTEGLSDTICVVVRYFGGIKLGAGGLIRAYGNSARQVLRESPRIILSPKSTIRIEVAASFVGAIYDIASKFNGSCNNEEYNSKGNVLVTITCEKSKEKEVQSSILDSTRGSAIILNS
jgi:uncharacterized YigZ family protein